MRIVAPIEDLAALVQSYVNESKVDPWVGFPASGDARLRESEWESVMALVEVGP